MCAIMPNIFTISPFIGKVCQLLLQSVRYVFCREIIFFLEKNMNAYIQYSSKERDSLQYWRSQTLYIRHPLGLCSEQPKQPCVGALLGVACIFLLTNPIFPPRNLHYPEFCVVFLLAALYHIYAHMHI